MNKVSRAKVQAYAEVAPLALALERSVESTLMEALPLERPVLDIGCGDGIFASMTFRSPVDFGLDPDPRELLRAEESGAYQHLLRATGDSIPLPNDSISTVISNSVLEHIPDLNSVFPEIYRVLRPAGRLYFTVPTENFDAFSNMSLALESLHLHAAAKSFRRAYNKFWRHYNFMSALDWGSWVASHGFTQVETRSYNPKINCRINDALVPLGGPSKLLKVTRNRWVLLPRLRPWLIKPLVGWLTPALDGALSAPAGGLVLVSARKPKA